ncbi:MAG: WD40/YVTN/BNR-like repeat-containing protein [Candidatus Dormibacteraceae bacterium]
MGPPEPQPDYDPPVRPARARRALSLILVSLLVIAVTGLAYLRPSLSPSGAPLPPSAAAAYQLAAVDFVSPTTGWFAATFDSGRFVIMHTADAANHWTRQLGGEVASAGVYLKFFNRNQGLVALLGPQSLIYRTADGGRTWSSRAILSGVAYLTSVTSVSFVDPAHGWLLLSTPTVASGADLVRTSDGGTTWTNLGSPVVANDQAYRVQFTDLRVGWLDTMSARAYAYKTTDGGATWRQVTLPAPRGGWPATGQFFVAAGATQGIGVIATVANFAPTSGRSGIGAKVVSYPPLTVRAFDGGVPVYYVYATVVDAIPSADLTGAQEQHRSGSSSQVQAPNQVQLGSLDGGTTWSVIAPPAAPGAIGYTDAQNWWWIGSGAWSTSSDGGTTWTPYRNVGVPQPLSGSLQVLDSEHAWFGSMAGTRAVLVTTDDGGIHWQMIVLPTINPS